jgi:hypothetical protein
MKALPCPWQPRGLVPKEKIQRRIYEKYSLYSWEQEALVHLLDRSICIDEMEQLMHSVDPELHKGNRTPLGIKIRCWAPKKARREYLKEAKRLGIRD